MEIKLDNITNPEVKAFYSTYLNDRKIIRDFYDLVPEDKYDFRMVDNSERRSNSIKEILAHLIEVQLMYINGLKTGKLEFKDMGVRENYYSLPKEELLQEMDRVEEEMFNIMNANNFDSNRFVEAPWGKVNTVSVVYGLQSHEVLHTGYNMAIMEHLNMPKYCSLQNTWG